MSSLKVTPKRRFPEFIQEIDWKMEPLGNFLSYMQPTKFLVSNTNYKDSNDTPVLTAGKTFILGYTDEKDGVFKEDLPVIIFDDFTTSIQYVDFPFKAKSSAMKILRAKGSNSPRFFFELIKNINYEVAAHERHWISIFSKLLVPVPQLHDEQMKVASYFQSVENLITAEREKLENFISHRKGLMQNLFPKQGEFRPEFRFPEFRNEPDWKERKLSDLLKKTADPVLINKGKSYQQIGIRSHGKGIFHKDLVTGDELGNKRVFWVKKNAFVVNIVFAWELAIACTTSEEDGMIASHRFPMYLPRNNSSDTRYMKYFFLTDKGKELLWIASPGGAGRNKTLGQKDFQSLTFLAPEVGEQKRIAECLSSIDSVIAIQSEKIEQLEFYKKGMIQELFPSKEVAE